MTLTQEKSIGLPHDNVPEKNNNNYLSRLPHSPTVLTHNSFFTWDAWNSAMCSEINSSLYILYHQKQVWGTLIVNSFIKYLIKKNRQKQLKVVLPEWIFSKMLNRALYPFDTAKIAKLPWSTTFLPSILPNLTWSNMLKIFSFNSLN